MGIEGSVLFRGQSVSTAAITVAIFAVHHTWTPQSAVTVVQSLYLSVVVRHSWLRQSVVAGVQPLYWRA